jgi:hypothetical protein
MYLQERDPGSDEPCSSHRVGLLARIPDVKLRVSGLAKGLNNAWRHWSKLDLLQDLRLTAVRRQGSAGLDIMQQQEF